MLFILNTGITKINEYNSDIIRNNTMDIDNETSDVQGGNEMDLEQSLLQQFSCLGTTDKDDLVKQLQKFIGNHLNETTASFFLDMNNWNLQAAICSYFDVDAPYKLPSMALMSGSATESENVEPSTRFQKIWQIYNNGTEQWPIGCQFQFSAGENLAEESHIPVQCLAPGESMLLTLNMISPPAPGTYQSKWRMCTSNGSYFGDPVWVIVTVIERDTVDLSQQLSHLTDLGSSPSHPISLNPFSQSREGNQETDAPDQDVNMC